MQQLHLVGITTDREGLIFSTRRGARSGGYVVPITPELLDSLAQAHRSGQDAPEGDDPPTSGGRPRRLPSGIRPESRLTPRQMQALLRAGHTLSQVAKAAGMEEEWVEGFAAPILAEQARILETAFAMKVVKSRGGESALPLAESVRVNLHDKGVPLSPPPEGWTVQTLGEGRWLLRLEYVSRRRNQVAEWELDLPNHDLICRNRLAGDLGYVASARRRIPEPPSPPPTSAGSESAPRAPGSGPGSGSVAGAAAVLSSPRRAVRRSGSASKRVVRKASPRKASSRKSATTTRTAVKRGQAKRPATKRAATKRPATKRPATKRPATKRAAAKRTGAKRVVTQRTAAKPAVTKKRSASKVVVRKTSARRTTPRKATAARPPSGRTATRKSASKKSASKKSGTKRTAPRKSLARPVPARKAPTRKTAARRSPARKSPAGKAPARKATGRKATGRKATGRKVTGRKVTGRKVTGRKAVATKATAKKAPRKRVPRPGRPAGESTELTPVLSAPPDGQTSSVTRAWETATTQPVSDEAPVVIRATRAEDTDSFEPDWLSSATSPIEAPTPDASEANGRASRTSRWQRLARPLRAR